MQYFIGIEAGGTKFICAVGNENGEICERTRINTTTPTETMPLVYEYIQQQQEKYKISAIGIASFGPLELDPHSPKYGFITTTPKLAWVDFDMFGSLKREFDLPIGFDTDVNAAALGEYRWGAAVGLPHFLYVTIGTGIGTGAFMNGRVFHGAMHLEAGHMLIPHHGDDFFEGICPYHKDCLEGLASGPAMKARWQVKSALDLPSDHKAWDLEANYLAIACMNFILMFSPMSIILGGGVMKQTQLLSLIRKKVIQLLGGYITHDRIIKNTERYIVPPGLGENAGICGTIALADLAYLKSLE